jgi:hypothetical protein
MPPPVRTPPVLLRWAAALVSAEALVLVGLAIFLAVELAVATAASVATGAGLAVLALLGGAGLAWCAWGLWRARRWSRSPALAAQLLGVPISWDLAGSQRASGIVALVWVWITAGLLLSRQVTDSLESSG